MLMGGQLRWIGHVLRMPDYRLPRRTLCSQLSDGARNVGAPRKRYKDQIKKAIKNYDINPDNLEIMILDRAEWRTACYRGASFCEAERTRQREHQRARRHERQQQPVPINIELQCPDCGRQCGSRIGLYSHRRTHQQRQH